MPFPIMQFFKCDHLPEPLRAVSQPYQDLALRLAATHSAHPAEVAAGLRKLLEAKDCAVRAALPIDGGPKGGE